MEAGDELTFSFLRLLRTISRPKAGPSSGWRAAEYRVRSLTWRDESRRPVRTTDSAPCSHGWPRQPKLAWTQWSRLN